MERGGAWVVGGEAVHLAGHEVGQAGTIEMGGRAHGILGDGACFRRMPRLATVRPAIPLGATIAWPARPEAGG
jgi:hypothetical protein